MFAIPTLGGVRMSAYSAGGGIWDSPNRAEVFRRPPRWIRGSAGAGELICSWKDSIKTTMYQTHTKWPK